MVRNYRPDSVPLDAIERIVATVRRAPSGGYSQGQRLIVVRDPDTRARMAELAREPEYVARGYEPWISRAPVQIIVATREEDYHERYRQPDKLQDGREIEWPVPYWYVDAGAALMLLLLAAIDEGLAAGVYGVPAEQMAAFKELLRIPADVHLVAVVTIGFGADDPAWSASASRRTRARRPLDSIVYWEAWSGKGG
jgi:FMN reductase [NAD(P)H]